MAGEAKASSSGFGHLECQQIHTALMVLTNHEANDNVTTSRNNFLEASRKFTETIRPKDRWKVHKSSTHDDVSGTMRNSGTAKQEPRNENRTCLVTGRIWSCTATGAKTSEGASAAT